MADPKQQETKHPTKKCPDCGNQKMIDTGKRFNVFSGQFEKSIKCTQCRRWIYNEQYAPPRPKRR